jgi:hypothetical protein
MQLGATMLYTVTVKVMYKNDRLERIPVVVDVPDNNSPQDFALMLYRQSPRYSAAKAFISRTYVAGAVPVSPEHLAIADRSNSLMNSLDNLPLSFGAKQSVISAQHTNVPLNFRQALAEAATHAVLQKAQPTRKGRKV